eukprot:CAMPEP_0194349410 /NCGR_PEP_ID=MMETSP0171-20130528/107074_1 /TAXON_ID=218684 /ORGANISM="Corethron pennatum, Strain L29A3" /LENGTH=435 /DNA_ID=CAMNT_0039116859 /DNA_START=454 /DNA_END=1761 /DNA_ORIENTATION=+
MSCASAVSSEKALNTNDGLRVPSKTEFYKRSHSIDRENSQRNVRFRDQTYGQERHRVERYCNTKDDRSSFEEEEKKVSDNFRYQNSKETYSPSQQDADTDSEVKHNSPNASNFERTIPNYEMKNSKEFGPPVAGPIFKPSAYINGRDSQTLDSQGEKNNVEIMDNLKEFDPSVAGPVFKPSAYINGSDSQTLDSQGEKKNVEIMENSKEFDPSVAGPIFKPSAYIDGRDSKKLNSQGKGFEKTQSEAYYEQNAYVDHPAVTTETVQQRARSVALPSVEYLDSGDTDDFSTACSSGVFSNISTTSSPYSTSSYDASRHQASRRSASQQEPSRQKSKISNNRGHSATAAAAVPDFSLIDSIGKIGKYGVDREVPGTDADVNLTDIATEIATMASSTAFLAVAAGLSAVDGFLDSRSDRMLIAQTNSRKRVTKTNGKY